MDNPYDGGVSIPGISFHEFIQLAKNIKKSKNIIMTKTKDI